MNIQVTDSAKEKILDALKGADFIKPALRVVFSGVGWGGPRLGLALDESDNTEEQVTIQNDIPVMYDEDIKRFMGSEVPIVIDYQETPYGAGFTIDNGTSCW